MKQLIRENTNAVGKLDNKQFTRAILQYRNTLQKNMGISPAESLFGWQIRDFLPVTRESYKPQRQWIEKIKAREEKVSKNREEAGKRWSRNMKTLTTQGG